MENQRVQSFDTIVDDLDDETLDILESMLLETPRQKFSEYHRKTHFPLFGAGKRLIRFFGKNRRSSATNQSMIDVGSVLNTSVPRKTTSLPVLGPQGISQLLYNKLNRKADYPDESFERKEIMTITLHRDYRGFGFSIKGGADNNYIPGDPGIFVSQIHEHGPAYKDGRLKVGDRIIAVNDRSLVCVRHEDAATAIRSIQDTAEIAIEVGAEVRTLERPTGLLGTTKLLPTESPTADRVTAVGIVELPTSEKSDIETASLPSEVSTGRVLIVAEDMATAGPQTVVNPTNFAEPLSEDLTPVDRTDATLSSPVTSQTIDNSLLKLESHYEENTSDEDASDAESITALSYVTGTLVDEVPRTPKRPFSFLDPSSASVFTEVLVVTTGLTALGVAIYFGYKYIKNR